MGKSSCVWNVSVDPSVEVFIVVEVKMFQRSPEREEKALARIDELKESIKIYAQDRIKEVQNRELVDTPPIFATLFVTLASVKEFGNNLFEAVSAHTDIQYGMSDESERNKIGM